MTDDDFSQPVVSLRNIKRIFGKGESAVHALDGVDLDIPQGEFIAVMGASGSGKSTCMNIIGCLDRPTSGSYFFCGLEAGRLSTDDLALVRRYQIGFIFQGFNLLARTSAWANVELPLIYQRVSKKERRTRALRSLDDVGLLNRARHLPNELSGGQQQRVAIARALVTNPRLIVADEPTGNLDSATKIEVMTLLAELNREKNITIVMVTHESDMAEYAHRKVVFVDGRIVSDSKKPRESND